MWAGEFYVCGPSARCGGRRNLQKDLGPKFSSLLFAAHTHKAQKGTEWKSPHNSSVPCEFVCVCAGEGACVGHTMIAPNLLFQLVNDDGE